MQLDVFAEAIWGLDTKAKIDRVMHHIRLPDVYVLVNGVEMPVHCVRGQHEDGKIIIEAR